MGQVAAVVPCHLVGAHGAVDGLRDVRFGLPEERHPALVHVESGHLVVACPHGTEEKNIVNGETKAK